MKETESPESVGVSDTRTPPLNLCRGLDQPMRHLLFSPNSLRLDLCASEGLSCRPYIPPLTHLRRKTIAKALTSLTTIWADQRAILRSYLSWSSVHTHISVHAGLQKTPWATHCESAGDSTYTLALLPVETRCPCHLLCQNRFFTETASLHH